MIDFRQRQIRKDPILAAALGALVVALVVGPLFATRNLSRTRPDDIPRRRVPLLAANPPPGRYEGVRHLMACPATPERDDECLHRLLALAAKAPKATLDFAESHLQGDLRAQAVTALFTQWAQTDPEGALNRACSDASKASEVAATMLEIARDDPQTARVLVEQISSRDPEAASVAYPAAIQGMATSGAFEDARSLIEDSSAISGTARELMIETLADQWGRNRPEEAAAWVQSISDPTSRDHALIALSTGWSGIDPKAASDFAIALPPSAARQAVLGQAVAQWASIDSLGAAEWLVQFPPSPDFDQAVARLAVHPSTVANHVDLALDWAGNIFDPTLRLSTVNAVLSELYARDPADALRRLRDMKILSDDDRQSLAVQLQAVP